MTIAQMVAEEHYAFAKIISKQYCFKIGFDMTEDLEADGLVGLVRATMPGKPSFKSWAAFKIRSEIRSSIGNSFRTKKGRARGCNYNFYRRILMRCMSLLLSV